MIRVSTDAKYQMMLALASIMQGGVFRVYSGPIPASADLAPTGTYLGYITRDDLPVGAGNGLSLNVATNGYISMPEDEVWKMKGIATGVAGYGRMQLYDDPSVDSPTAGRIDFEVNGPDNIGILIPNANIIPGLSRIVTGFYYTIPG